MGNFIFEEFAPLIPIDQIRRAGRLSPALLCDGMKGMGIESDGCVDAAVMPVSISERLVGTAYTVHTANGNNYPIHIALYDKRIKPGYVLVVAGEAAEERCYLGDLIGSTAKAIGLSGIIVDGYVRDRLGLAELDYPVFARGFKQRSPSKIAEGEINTAVRFGGIDIAPGDLIVGDADGITVVPRDMINAVLDAAEEKQRYEEKRKIQIAEYERCKQSGETPPELAPKWVLDMQCQVK